MSRPTYESREQLEVEASIGEFLRGLWQFDHAKKLDPHSYSVDFAMLRGRDINCWVEAKDRPGLPIRYGDGYYLAVQKLVRALALEQATSVPSVLVIQCKELEIGYWKMSERLPGAIWAGREDRGDKSDMEPHVIFPWAKFKLLYPGAPPRANPEHG
jgi:hypothetical protein